MRSPKFTDAAVEGGHLGLEVEQRVAVVALGSPAGRAGREVEDRLAAALADALDEVGVGVAVLGRGAVVLARVEVDHRGAGAPGRDGGVGDLVGGDREVRPALGIGRLRAGHGALDHDGVGHVTHPPPLARRRTSSRLVSAARAPGRHPHSFGRAGRRDPDDLPARPRAGRRRLGRGPDRAPRRDPARAHPPRRAGRRAARPAHGHRVPGVASLRAPLAPRRAADQPDRGQRRRPRAPPAAALAGADRRGRAHDGQPARADLAAPPLSPLPVDRRAHVPLGRRRRRGLRRCRPGPARPGRPAPLRLEVVPNALDAPALVRPGRRRPRGALAGQRRAAGLPRRRPAGAREGLLDAAAGVRRGARTPAGAARRARRGRRAPPARGARGRAGNRRGRPPARRAPEPLRAHGPLCRARAFFPRRGLPRRAGRGADAPLPDRRDRLPERPARAARARTARPAGPGRRHPGPGRRDGGGAGRSRARLAPAVRDAMAPAAVARRYATLLETAAA